MHSSEPLDPINILRNAESQIDRTRLWQRQMMVDAIYYLRTGQYPHSRRLRANRGDAHA